MLTSGTTLHNRYTVMDLLGQGGMGAVYKAWDTELNVPCAIKEMLPPQDANATALAQLRQQFQDEARTLATLHHSNLPRVTGFFIERGNEYLVMDFVQGESLSEIVERQGAIDEARVRAWTHQILDVLAYIHGRGVLHRDISPQNLILTDEGRVMLVDFGLVKAWDASNPVTRTAVRGLGKAEYSPPEQYNMTGEHTAPSSDIYALGATLYHLVTGQAPPSVTDRMANPEGFAKPRLLKKQVSEQMESVILRAMEISRKDRFQSAQEMRRAIKGESIRTAASDQGTNVPGHYLLILALLGAVAIGFVLWSVIGGKGATPTPTFVTTLSSGATLVAGGSSPSVTLAPTLAATPTRTFTPTPTRTFTPTPTRTFTPTPTPYDIPISLERFGNDDVRNLFVSLPIGEVYLGGVKFLISEENNKISTQCDAQGRSSWPTEVSVPVGDIGYAETVYLLINAGYGFSQYEGVEIGLVRLVFRDERSLDFPLTLGENIREWSFPASGAVVTAPGALQVWYGERDSGQDAVLDMLSLQIPQHYRDSPLHAITFYDISQEVLDGDLNPCFFVVGITIHGYDE